MNKNQVVDTFGTKTELETGFGKTVFYRLNSLVENGFSNIERMPFSIKILLESVLRNENGFEITRHDVERIATYNPANPLKAELPFRPARVLLQDFTGVPTVVDLAALRSAMARIGGDPERINPLIPVDLVIDHSLMIDAYGSPQAFDINARKEFERNKERYEFLHWGQRAFKNFRVVPPASGICHQVNLEYIAKVVQRMETGGETCVFPDTLVGTDSHTTMINGIGVVGWGVGGVEAEAVMLGQPIYMLIPDVVGLKLTGEAPVGTTATDVVLTVTELLRKAGVVGKFVEYFGPGLKTLTVPDRATLSNMSPEYGATIGFFPVDDQTLEFLRYTGRSKEQVDLVERYCKEQSLFLTNDSPEPLFKSTVELDLSTIEPSLAGPKRPQDRVSLSRLKSRWHESLRAPFDRQGFTVSEADAKKTFPVSFGGREKQFAHGDVLIAAITSCTNTSNPAVLIGAGILAKKAVEAGLSTQPHVKTSLAPGSRVVTDYLTKSGLMPYLEKLGFHVVGYGCTTCIGNSGPVIAEFAESVESNNVVAASVLSGNRNFTGRISPHTKASYLASPPLVVAFALAGTIDIDMENAPLGKGSDGRDVYLRDIWPSNSEISERLKFAQNPEVFNREYSGIEESNETWNAIKGKSGEVYEWDAESTYIQEPSFFVGMKRDPEAISPIDNARVLIMAGDSITTDHISPAGVIPAGGPAGKYLIEKGVKGENFNSFGSRRGNDRVMTRGTFANIMFRNKLAGGREGGWTVHHPTGELTTIYDASLMYGSENTPLIVLAGKDYGMGSSRDWAAKGTMLLGVRAVIAESFERIHRSNLVGMGVLPLQFKPGQDPESIGLSGREVFSIQIDDNLTQDQEVNIKAVSSDGKIIEFTVDCRLDTPVEVEYYRNGGILQTVLRKIFRES